MPVREEGSDGSDPEAPMTPWTDDKSSLNDDDECENFDSVSEQNNIIFSSRESPKKTSGVINCDHLSEDQ